MSVPLSLVQTKSGNPDFSLPPQLLQRKQTPPFGPVRSGFGLHRFIRAADALRKNKKKVTRFS